MRALVIEDHPRMSALLERCLQEEGYAVDVAGNGVDGVWLGRGHEYDVIVLDLGLPDMDGADALRSPRENGKWAPVLILTARDAVEDRVRGLDAGADDYLVKPFALPELLARIRALIRRTPPERPSVLTVGDLTLDPAAHQVRRGDTPIPLSPKRSEEHTSELQSREKLVCRLLLEKKKKKKKPPFNLKKKKNKKPEKKTI